MLARRLLQMRRSTFLSSGPVIPNFTPVHIPVGVGSGKGFRAVSARVNDSIQINAYYGGTGGSVEGPVGHFPYLSDDELGWEHGYTTYTPPSPIPTSSSKFIKQRPAVPEVPSNPNDIIAEIEIPIEFKKSCHTLLRDCIFSYDHNRTEITRMNWYGQILPSLDLTPHSLTTKTTGLWTSSGRHAVLFEPGSGSRQNELGHQLRDNTAHAHPTVNPELRAPNPKMAQLTRFLVADQSTTTFPDGDYEFGFSIDAQGTVKKFSFNNTLFSLPIPPGAENVPIWHGTRLVTQLDRCQAADGVYILARILAQDIRSNGQIDQVFWGDRYLRRVRASYSSRYMVAILRIVEDQITFHQILCDGSGYFPYGDYAYHQVSRTNIPWYRGIEWTRPPGSESRIETTNQTISSSSTVGQISRVEYLQHFDHISAPPDPDPAFPWAIGYTSGLVNKIPHVSATLFDNFNSTGFVTSSFPRKLLLMSFDGRHFYIVRRGPMNSQAGQYVYKIDYFTGDVAVLFSGVINTEPLYRIKAFPVERLLVTEAFSSAGYRYANQIDMESGQLLPLKPVSSGQNYLPYDSSLTFKQLLTISKPPGST